MSSKLTRLLALGLLLLALALAAAEGLQPTSGPDFWAGLWDSEEAPAPRADGSDFWAGLWGEDETKPESPMPTAKPGQGKLYKI